MPVEVLDLGFANWHTGERATFGVPSDTGDSHVLEHARAALEV